MSPRIPALTDEEAPAASRTILEATKKAVGRVPNLHRTLAHSPAALRAYAETSRALAGGVLSPALREHVAVATAGINGCAYCASAHTALGKAAGIHEAELTLNLGAESSEPEIARILRFVRSLLEQRGDVDDDEVAALRSAGLGDAEIVEIVAHVAMSWFTNTLNVLARTSIDFPEVRLQSAC